MMLLVVTTRDVAVAENADPNGASTSGTIGTIGNAGDEDAEGNGTGAASNRNTSSENGDGNTPTDDNTPTEESMDRIDRMTKEMRVLDFQSVWSSEMNKSNRNSLQSQNSTTTGSDTSEHHVSEWFEIYVMRLKTLQKRPSDSTMIQRQVSQMTKDLFAEKKRLQQRYQQQHRNSYVNNYEDL